MARWSGTVEERYAHLDKRDRRCDGNSRHCPRNAVEEYTLYPADGHGNRLPDAEPIKKKSCGYHRAQFLENGMYSVSANRQLPRQAPGRRRTFDSRETNN